jgi:hypothetical protein
VEGFADLECRTTLEHAGRLTVYGLACTLESFGQVFMFSGCALHGWGAVMGREVLLSLLSEGS